MSYKKIEKTEKNPIDYSFQSTEDLSFTAIQSQKEKFKISIDFLVDLVNLVYVDNNIIQANEKISNMGGGLKHKFILQIFNKINRRFFGKCFENKLFRWDFLR